MSSRSSWVELHILEQDLVRDADLANIVQCGGDPDVVDPRVGDHRVAVAVHFLQSFSEDFDERTDALEMLPGEAIAEFGEARQPENDGVTRPFQFV